MEFGAPLIQTATTTNSVENSRASMKNTSFVDSLHTILAARRAWYNGGQM
jgi:hypothetical protein